MTEHRLADAVNKLSSSLEDHAKVDLAAHAKNAEDMTEVRAAQERNYEAHLENTAKLDKLTASVAGMVEVWGTGSSLAKFIKILAPFLLAITVIGGAVVWGWTKLKGLLS